MNRWLGQALIEPELSDPRPIKLPVVLALPGSGHRKTIDIG